MSFVEKVVAQFARPKSSLIAEYIRKGVYQDVQSQAEVRKYRQERRKQK